MRLRVDVEGREENPQPFAGMEQAVVLQVIVVVGDQDGKQDAAVQFSHLFAGIKGMRPQRIGDVRVEGASGGLDAKERLGGKIGDSPGRIA